MKSWRSRPSRTTRLTSSNSSSCSGLRSKSQSRRGRSLTARLRQNIPPTMLESSSTRPQERFTDRRSALKSSNSRSSLLPKYRNLCRYLPRPGTSSSQAESDSASQRCPVPDVAGCPTLTNLPRARSAVLFCTFRGAYRPASGPLLGAASRTGRHAYCALPARLRLLDPGVCVEVLTIRHNFSKRVWPDLLRKHLIFTYIYISMYIYYIRYKNATRVGELRTWLANPLDSLSSPKAT